MACAVIGFNVHTAPLHLREEGAAIDPAKIPNILQRIRQYATVQEVAILSTCHRFEVIWSGCMADPQPKWLQENLPVNISTLSPYLYTHKNEAAIRHLLRLGSGLDSLLMGEPQILGQLKKAYQTALEAGTIGAHLIPFFQFIFQHCKTIRHNSNIGAHPVTLHHGVLNVAKQHGGTLTDKTMLIIGAGETAQKIATHFYSNDIGNCIIANRSLPKAKDLAKQCNAKAIPLSQIAEVLPAVDLIVSATASPAHMLHQDNIIKARETRPHQPYLLVDLAMPRDIDPTIGTLPNVTLIHLDELLAGLQAATHARKDAAMVAEKMVEDALLAFHEEMKTMDAVDSIKHYREHILAIKTAELQRAKALLAKGDSPEAALTDLAHRLVNKIMHCPMMQLRMAAKTGREDILESAKLLFQTEVV